MTLATVYSSWKKPLKDKKEATAGYPLRDGLTQNRLTKLLLISTAFVGIIPSHRKWSRFGPKKWSRNLEWIESLGSHPSAETSFYEKGEFPELPGADCAHVYRIENTPGNSTTWLVLKEAVEKRKIEVLYSAPGKKLMGNSAF
jgi:hypothetical protein